MVKAQRKSRRRSLVTKTLGTIHQMHTMYRINRNTDEIVIIMFPELWSFSFEMKITFIEESKIQMFSGF